MIKIRTILFSIQGIIGLLFQLFGFYAFAAALMIITHTWFWITICVVLLSVVDIWKRRVYSKMKEYKPTFFGYTKS